MKRPLVLSVALAIRHFRKEKNLSQEELADMANLDRTYISGVERGVRNITLESLDHIIHALQIDCADFFKFATKDNNDGIHH